MERYLNKKYRLVESENFDEYLRRNKVKFFYRKLEHIVRQTIKLSEKDGKYVFENFWPMTSSSFMFRTGVPFDEVRMDGVVAKSVVEFKDNKMIHSQTVNDIESTFIREFSDKHVIVTITCGDIVSSRMYARIYERMPFVKVQHPPWIYQAFGIFGAEEKTLCTERNDLSVLLLVDKTSCRDNKW